MRAPSTSSPAMASWPFLAPRLPMKIMPKEPVMPPWPFKKPLGEYGDKIEKDTGVAFKMRVGLNSGPVIVGAIGDDLRMDYTAVGDTTNLGSRMEGMARPGAVLVSGNTHRLVRDFFEFESLGKVAVKGKKEPQEAFELIKAGEVGTRIGASIAKGLTRFVGRKNSMAALLDAFDKVTSGSRARWWVL